MRASIDLLVLALTTSQEHATHLSFHRVIEDWQEGIASFVARLPQIISMIVLAIILIKIINMVTLRIAKIAERHARDTVRVSQIKTLSTVLRNTGIGLIITMTIMIVLGSLGINLGPLVASAGIAGVAVGLAAQTIVKDVLNGMLILVEDQFSVGDTVQIAGFKGVVENMSLRKTMLRDGDGTLYMVPNSQITNVANFSRDFSSPTLSVSVDFSVPPDEAIKVLLDAALEVRHDPAYSDFYLEDPTVLGVESIKGSEVFYLLQLRTKANQYASVLRETRRRIQLALEKNKMLPGNPFRVPMSGKLPVMELTGGSTTPAVDPTTLPPNEINPFSGQ